ncbi:MAG: methyltransferase domain-containing protein [Candidatus Omnitrophica bacterium]|nr:methyltransferase domain-containing protein [Candidatus Omnitrophota bacterium]
MIDSKIQNILRCPDCHKEEILKDKGGFRCASCNRHYEIKNSIPDFCASKTMRMPKIYSEIEYQKFQENLVFAQNYFYNSGGIISWVQNAGHRAIRSIMKGRHYNFILDIGCGNGAHYPFVKSDGMYFGIDIDQGSLENLKEKFPGFFAMRADCYELPIKNESIDCILNIYNLEHLVYLDLALEEISRILVPQGDIFISIPNEGGFAWNTGRRMTSFRKFKGHLINYPRVIDIQHINCIWQIEKTIKRYFNIKKKISFPLFIPIHGLNLITTYYCAKK